MDGTSKSKRRSKLQKRKENENKLKSEECTPVKHLVPQAHSTPLSCNVVTASPTEDEVQIISDDEEEEMHYAFKFQCTQDTLDVDWDDSPKRKPSKILGSKVKRKLSKGESFSQKKRNLKVCSPVQPLRSRRRFIVEKPNNDFSELIRDLQAIAKQCENFKDETSGTSEDNSCEKGTSSSKENENLEAKIQEQSEHCSIECRGTEDKKGSRAVVNEKHNSSNIQVPSEHPLPRAELKLEEKSKNNKINETFTALFDDDDDECMVQCSQEVENKLNSNVPVSDNCDNDFPSVDRNELSSVGYKNKNIKLENSTKSSQSHITGPSKSPKSRIKCYVRNKSGQLSNCRTNDCPCSKTSTHTCYNDINSDLAKTSFKSAITSEVFDDSFDAVIQNFTEEDIIMLSQGVALEKEERNNLNSDRKPQNFQLSEIAPKMNLKKEPVINSSLPKTSNVCKLPTNSTLHHISSNKQVNVGTNLNRLCASSNSKVQLQVKAPTSVNSTRLSNEPKSIESVQFSSRDRTVVNSVPSITRRGQNNTATRTGNSANMLTTQSFNATLQSSPQKCTPEEIQKKRLEAKMKLEKKKLAMLFQKNKQQHRLKAKNELRPFRV
ncbi:uncharacterized protein [Periplaneta americana]|uniref:uncharacterized protein isoform X2 n=1 Tax=Periplaneta americana TaxID=6978 RepID=UPI0037E789A7